MESSVTSNPNKMWGSGSDYERYIGRWSRVVAGKFLAGLEAGSGLTWGDVGCGTGALTQNILTKFNPAKVHAVDRAAGFIRAARQAFIDSRVQFALSDAAALPWTANSCDAAVSGLVLNFMTDPAIMASEMVRVTRPGGIVAAYVWDYRSGMQMLRYFWDAAVEFNPDVSMLDPAEHFPICQPEPLESLFIGAGLMHVSVTAIEIPTIFTDFDDYWVPFLGKQGPAPAYLAGLSIGDRNRLRDTLKSRLPAAPDGSIPLIARAWAIMGRVPLDKSG